MRYRLFVSFMIIVLTSFGLVNAQDDPLIVVAHDSFAVSEDVLEAFEDETGITVEILRAGDAGQVVNQSVLSAGNPLGDVLFGVDNTFLSRALNADIFIPYESPALENVDERFILDSEYRVTPIDYGDVCINYDTGYFEENDLAVPQSLADLTRPEYEGLLVVENPAVSSPGLAFLLATIAEFGTPDDAAVDGTEDSTADDVENDYSYLDYWADLVDNDVLITDDWSTAYFSNFTQGGEGGSYPLVVSYASSPPFTYDEETEMATTASIVADGMCFRQIEFAGILDGTEKEEQAQQFIDFMLSETFQEDIPLQMFVFPVNVEAELPEVFAEYAQIPDNPAEVDYDEIEENREAWVSAWTETVLGR